MTLLLLLLCKMAAARPLALSADGSVLAAQGIGVWTLGADHRSAFPPVGTQHLALDRSGKQVFVHPRAAGSEDHVLALDSNKATLVPWKDGVAEFTSDGKALLRLYAEGGRAWLELQPLAAGGAQARYELNVLATQPTAPLKRNQEPPPPLTGVVSIDADLTALVVGQSGAYASVQIGAEKLIFVLKPGATQPTVLHRGDAGDLQLSPDEQLLRIGRHQLLDLRTGQALGATLAQKFGVPGQGSSWSLIGCTPQGLWMNKDGALVLLDPTSWAIKPTSQPLPRASTLGLYPSAWSADGGRMAWVSHAVPGKELTLFNSQKPSEVLVFQGSIQPQGHKPRLPVTQASAPSGERRALVASDKQLGMGDLDAPALIVIFAAPGDPQGEALARALVATYPGGVRVELRDQQELVGIGRPGPAVFVSGWRVDGLPSAESLSGLVDAALLEKRRAPRPECLMALLGRTEQDPVVQSFLSSWGRGALLERDGASFWVAPYGVTTTLVDGTVLAVAMLARPVAGQGAYPMPLPWGLRAADTGEVVWTRLGASTLMRSPSPSFEHQGWPVKVEFNRQGQLGQVTVGVAGEGQPLPMPQGCLK